MKHRELGEAILKQHLEQGNIWYDATDMEFVGRASDGLVVGFGDNRDGLIMYLLDRPNPTDW